MLPLLKTEGSRTNRENGVVAVRDFVPGVSHLLDRGLVNTSPSKLMKPRRALNQDII
jgi:hypothetical protein